MTSLPISGIHGLSGSARIAIATTGVLAMPEAEVQLPQEYTRDDALAVLAIEVDKSTHMRVRGVRVEICSDTPKLIMSGRARLYYVKQLASEGLRIALDNQKLLNILGFKSIPEVENNIEVV